MKFRMATIPIGDKATFEILQKGKKKSIYVAAVAPVDIPPRHEKTLTGAHPLNGATISNINPAVAIETGIHEEEGVVIVKVSSQSQARRIVAPGDIILTLNGKAIKNVRMLEKEMQNNRNTSWFFVLSRNGIQRQVILR